MYIVLRSADKTPVDRQVRFLKHRSVTSSGRFHLKLKRDSRILCDPDNAFEVASARQHTVAHRDRNAATVYHAVRNPGYIADQRLQNTVFFQQEAGAVPD